VRWGAIGNWDMTGRNGEGLRIRPASTYPQAWRPPVERRGGRLGG